MIEIFFRIFLDSASNVSCLHTHTAKPCIETNITSWGVLYFYSLFCFDVRTVHFVQFYYPDQQMHNIYINKTLYIINIATCFDAPALSSGILNLMFCIQQTPTQNCPDCIRSHQTTISQLSLTFYRLYFIIQQRPHGHFNLLFLLSCNFN